MGFIKTWMYRAQKNKTWEFLCRWLIGWGIGAHIVALFLLIMSVT